MNSQPPPLPDPTWAFRGYHIKPHEFNTAMFHFYRGELTRANTWRVRIDTSLNWAVLLTGASLSLVLSSGLYSHVIIPFVNFALLGLLLLESRRYMVYEVWSHRVRLMETDYFGAMLTATHRPAELWAGEVVDSLTQPTFTISFWEAFGRRFRRNYQYLFLIMALVWLAKLVMHPTTVTGWDNFFARARVGLLSGEAVVAIGLLFYTALFLMGWLTHTLRATRGEILADLDLASPMGLFYAINERWQEWKSRAHHEEMAYVVTDKAHGPTLAKVLESELGANVTLLEGQGMYSHEAKCVLLVACLPEQREALEAMVDTHDPNAFVVLHHGII